MSWYAILFFSVIASLATGYLVGRYYAGKEARESLMDMLNDPRMNRK